MDEQSGDSTSKYDISGFSYADWPRIGNKPGSIFTGALQIPDNITPGALLVQYTGSAPAADKPDSNRVRNPHILARHLLTCSC